MVNKAVRVTKANGAVVETQSKPFSASDMDADEVLIKNVAVACNPKDWKLAAYGLFEGIEGNDVAGYVEAVGSDVKDLTKDDGVIALTRAAKADKYGAYQAYTVAPAWTTAKLADSISFEDGATVPLAATTAFVGLFDKLGLPEPSPAGRPSADADKVNLLVWGASSSVGAYVVQLARIAGFNIVAVAGAAQDAVKSLGVEGSKIVDYRADRTTVIANINAAAGAPITHVYDAISTKDTVDTIVSLLSSAPNKGGKLTTLLATAYDDETENQKLQREKGIVYNRTIGSVVHHDKKEFGERWFKLVAKWLGEGKMKPNKVQILEGGLDGVPGGLKLLQENKVSGAKLVARIADTKS
ncbi:Polyketide synthase, enoylreductase [Kalmanozyma brasiliensis GHG001]|uniref:Enoyl reductase (ER) domain-containing protein n=1 Tax=Kalmanozyma brasiliensis (strain GHG001) TaxID=1365824 RepID=V5EGR9_KALBG|nr:Polyketide synthase, enoylreductase [Kalmanozyma brasiliensis GHG001]EST09746.1 Polyketide synthase, enoylreductase [Kalmanozyma brasiliensis GHG001]